MKQDKTTSSRVDRGWGQMHQTLEAEMPQKKDRRIIFWILFGIAAISIAGFWLLNNPQQSNKSIATVNSKVKTEIKSVNEIRNKNSNSSKESRVDSKEGIGIKPVTNINTQFGNDLSNSSTISEKENVVSISNQEKNKVDKTVITNEKSVYSKPITKKEIIDEQTSINKKENSYIYNKKLIEASSNEKIEQVKVGNIKREVINFQSIKSIFNLINKSQSDKIEMKLIPEMFPIQIIKPTPWKTDFSLGVGADYFTSIRTIGASTLLSVQLSKKKWGFGIMGSYSKALYGRNQNNTFTLTNGTDNRLIASDIEGNIQDPVGTFAFNDPTYTSDNSIEESLSFLSLGVTINYLLTRKISISSFLGKEFHLNTYQISRVENEVFMDSQMAEPPEFIDLNFNNNYFIETGFNYNVSSNLSLMASYRYNPSTLINIIDFDDTSSKVSVGANYRF